MIDPDDIQGRLEKVRRILEELEDASDEDEAKAEEVATVLRGINADMQAAIEKALDPPLHDIDEPRLPAGVDPNIWLQSERWPDRHD